MRPPDSRTAAGDNPPGISRGSDFLTGYVVNFVESGLETALLATVEALAMQLTPLATMMMRTAFLSHQAHTVLAGLSSGRGFAFKVTIPGLDNVLPDYLQLTLRASLFGNGNVIKTPPGVWTEIEVFKPWVEQVDVEPADDTVVPGRIPPAECPAPADADVWRLWLSLLGPDLIHDLSGTLRRATGSPLVGMEQKLLARCYTDRKDMPGFPRP